MPLVVRKIKINRWFDPPWPERDQIQADSLLDLKTDGNSLSIYLIEDETEGLNRVVAALAASCDDLTHLDYALLEPSCLTSLGIEVVRSEGETPDAIVNGWHHDLVRLTVSKVSGLAGLIKKHAKRERRGLKEVARLIANGLRDGSIERGQVSGKAISGLEKLSLLPAGP